MSESQSPSEHPRTAYLRGKRHKRRMFVQRAKRKPCADCGIMYPSHVMQFDHVRGSKSFPISRDLYIVSQRRLEEEIAKCDVVCANCHALRSWGPIRISQEELLELADQWEPEASNSPPSYRLATCVKCGDPMEEMWHLWLGIGQFRKEVHLCRECGLEYGAVYDK